MSDGLSGLETAQRGARDKLGAPRKLRGKLGGGGATTLVERFVC